MAYSLFKMIGRSFEKHYHGYFLDLSRICIFIHVQQPCLFNLFHEDFAYKL